MIEIRSMVCEVAVVDSYHDVTRVIWIPMTNIGASGIALDQVGNPLR